MKKINLFYDGECPFCKEYSKYVQLRKKFDVRIINARDSLNEIKKFKELGFDINDGMILEFNDEIYQGADAIKYVDNQLINKKFSDKFYSLFIKSTSFKKFIYPLIKLVRILTLKILRKNTKIDY